MSKFLDILEACKCGKSEKDCCKGKCKGKCTCDKLKEADLSEAKAKVCPECGIKYSKLSKDEGFCTECATPIKESKYDSDEAGDFKYHSKKDDALDKDRCPECGSNKGYVKGKCISCGTTLQPKGIKESKFQKYLQEQELNEGVMDATLRKKIIASGIPVPSVVTVDAVNNIYKQLKAKGLDDLAAEVKSEDGVLYNKVELRNKTKFS